MACGRSRSELREQGIYRGIGIGTFVEQTAYGPPYYGPSGAPISTQDGCTLRLEPSGSVRCVTSLTDQGQGTLTAHRADRGRHASACRSTRSA